MKSNTLTPAMSAWLAETFKRNRELYGGMTMELDDDKDKKSDDDAGKDDKSGKSDDDKKDDSKKDDDFKSDHSKQSVLADLATEREARKKLETELAGFKTGLAEALGIKADDDKSKGDDVLNTVQQQLAEMRQESAVLKLANEHKITDKEDLELLATAKDADSMKKLAERLAPSEEEESDKKSGKKPRPDRSQGGGSGSSDEGNGTGGQSVAQIMAERRAAREAKSKTT